MLSSILAAMLAAASPSSPDLAAIQHLDDIFSAKANAGDAAGAAELYAADAEILPPNAPLISGRAGIEKYWAAAIAQVTDVHLTAVDVKQLGPSALRETGTYQMQTKGPTPQVLKGKYVVIWRQVGSQWKMATDIWN
jgi:uncharacterized protein (TIGR02246 family)